MRYRHISKAHLSIAGSLTPPHYERTLRKRHQPFTVVGEYVHPSSYNRPEGVAIHYDAKQNGIYMISADAKWNDLQLAPTTVLTI
ncbi:hypothetical protein R6Q59_028929 [Mikania micrantha]